LLTYLLRRFAIHALVKINASSALRSRHRLGEATEISIVRLYSNIGIIQTDVLVYLYLDFDRPNKGCKIAADRYDQRCGPGQPVSVSLLRKQQMKKIFLASAIVLAMSGGAYAGSASLAVGAGGSTATAISASPHSYVAAGGGGKESAAASTSGTTVTNAQQWSGGGVSVTAHGLSGGTASQLNGSLGLGIHF
jgi:hypothetical protein